VVFQEATMRALTNPSHIQLPNDLARILDEAPSWSLPLTREELVDRAVGGADSDSFRVTYDVPGRCTV